MAVSTCPKCGHDFSPEEAQSELAGMCPVCLAGIATGDGGIDPVAAPAPHPGTNETVYTPLKPGGKFRDLEILGHLGQGGMGVVYKARQVKLDRTVALKVLAPQYAASPEFIQRFEREAKILASINHPNVVQVYDFGQEGDLLFLVLEFVEGENLETIFKKTRNVSLPRFLHVVREATKALEAIHGAGLIHRDVKPANILLTKSGVTKLTDFGLAIDSQAKEKLTQSGLFVGTPDYVSPEHVQGKKIDARSDLYSMGVVLYEGIAGRPPFTAASNTALLMKHVQEAPPPLYKYAPNTPKEIGEVVRNLLAKNPASRQESASVLLRDLDRGIEAAKRQGSTKRATMGDIRILESEPTPPKTRRAVRSGSGKTVPWKLIAACAGGAVMLIVAITFLLGGSGEEAPPRPPAPKIAEVKPEPSQAPESSAPEPAPKKPTPVVPSPVPEPAPQAPAPAIPEPKVEPKQDETSKILEKALKDGDTLLADARKLYERGKAEKSVSLLTQAAFKAEAARVKYQAVIELGQGPLKQKAVIQNRAVQQLIKLSNEERLTISSPPPKPVAPSSAKKPAPEVPRKNPATSAKAPPKEPETPSATPQEEASPKKHPVPNLGAKKEALSLIRGIYKEDYSKRGKPDVQALARKLLEQAKDPNAAPVERFVLLDEARALGIKSGDIPTAISAVTLLGDVFEVDGLSLKQDALSDLSRSVRTKDAALELGDSFYGLCREAIQKNKYDVATTASRKVESLAKAAKDTFLLKRAKDLKSEITLLKREYQKVKAWFEKPGQGDPGAAGTFLCFVKADWERGLEPLSKSRSASLAALAKKDLERPREAPEQIALGDGWWDLAQKERTSLKKKNILARAGHWYQQALPNTTGLSKAKLNKRLESLAPVEKGVRINVLELVDLNRDKLSGEWSWQEKRPGASKLHCNGPSRSKVQLPYQPPVEYDFIVVFIPQSSTGEAGQIFTAPGTASMLFLGGWGNSVGGFQFVDNKLANENPTRASVTLVQHEEYTSVIKVRRNGVKAYLNGKLIAQYTDYRKMSLPSFWETRDKGVLGLGCNAAVLFLRAEVLEIAGKGKKLR